MWELKIHIKAVMAIVNYTYKFRIYPDKEQAVLLAKHFGCHRFIYKNALPTIWNTRKQMPKRNR